MSGPANGPANGPASGTGEDEAWTRVCTVGDIEVEGGVTALVGGRAVAVFRTHDDEVWALDNYDPFSHASVLSRGIVGTRTVAGESVPYVASPIYKQGFALRTGRCLDDETVSVPTYAVRLDSASDGAAGSGASASAVVLVGPVREQEHGG